MGHQHQKTACSVLGLSVAGVGCRWVIPVLWGPLVLTTIVSTLRNPALSAPVAVALIIAGVLLWLVKFTTICLCLSLLLQVCYCNMHTVSQSC